MAMRWKYYPRTEKIVELKYLRLLKQRFDGQVLHMRKAITEWAIERYPSLKEPMLQFGGSFTHKTQGIFIRKHGFLVTEGAIRREAKRRGLTPTDHIDDLIAIVWASGPSLRRRLVKRRKSNR